MKEIKILALLVVLVGILYWGVEPLAHSVFNPKTNPADFVFSDLDKLPITGDVKNGRELASTYCIACHGIEKDGFPSSMSAEDAINVYGVVPPDLSNIGALYDSNFLANLIKDPVKTLKLTHKFNDSKPFPMTPTIVSDNELGDIVAYFKSIGDSALASQVTESPEFKSKEDSINKSSLTEIEKQDKLNLLKEHLTNKQVFISACSRCHSMKYDSISSITPTSSIENYLGAKAPDLSMMIRSRGEEYLNKFINDPQKMLVNASMPRVGLTEEAQNKVIKYIDSIGDSKKEQRHLVGIIIISFMIIMSIIAYLWKLKIWKEVH